MDTESNKYQCYNCHRSPLGREKQLCGTRAYIGQKQGFLLTKRQRSRKAKENSKHPRWNTLPGQQRHASDKPFRCLQCPPDFQLVSKETCCVPESIHQIRPERKQCETPPALHRDMPTGYHSEGVSCSRVPGQQHTASSL